MAREDSFAGKEDCLHEITTGLKPGELGAVLPHANVLDIGSGV